MQQIYNPTGLRGIDFVEFAGGAAGFTERVLREFGFSKLKKHIDDDVYYYRQNDIHVLLNRRTSGTAARFAAAHGPSIPAMGWRFENAQKAYERAISRGAEPCEEADKTLPLPAIYGIGGSLIYFVDRFYEGDSIYEDPFVDLEEPELVEEKGFLSIDHLTNNVYKGTMSRWSEFYKKIFGFTEIRFFDIKGQKTGLTSYALQSPCRSFCIPINEGNEDKSQIEEYLRDYDGPGIQHLAFLTRDLLGSLDQIEGSSIEMLDINDSYYDEVFDRVPGVTEDPERIKRHQVLIDGDEEGYLLQIFTKNLFGPIFIELIQRKNHHSFGEGNFQALFDSIERDQERRGTL